MLRRKLICAGVMLAATVAGLLIVYFATAPRVMVENYQKINDGMVLADVEALLGRPVPVHSDALVGYYLLHFGNAGPLHCKASENFAMSDEGWRWDDNGGNIIVAFRPSGAVTFKRYDPPPDDPLLDRLRRWLGV